MPLSFPGQLPGNDEVVHKRKKLLEGRGLGFLEIAHNGNPGFTRDSGCPKHSGEAVSIHKEHPGRPDKRRLGQRAVGTDGSPGVHKDGPSHCLRVYDYGSVKGTRFITVDYPLRGDAFCL